MSILSLQSIIQKYGARYGIDTKAAIKDPAKNPGKNAGKNAVKDAGKDAGKSPAKTAPAGAPSKAPAKPDPATAKIPSVDSLKLSPAAKDFLASHTGALGKFEMPNVMDAFLGAMNGTDQSGSGSGNSLMDYLSGAGNDSANAGGSGATGAGNPFGTGSGAPKSLLDFL